MDKFDSSMLYVFRILFVTTAEEQQHKTVFLYRHYEIWPANESL